MEVEGGKEGGRREISVETSDEEGLIDRGLVPKGNAMNT